MTILSLIQSQVEIAKCNQENKNNSVKSLVDTFFVQHKDDFNNKLNSYVTKTEIDELIKDIQDSISFLLQMTPRDTTNITDYINQNNSELQNYEQRLIKMENQIEMMNSSLENLFERMDSMSMPITNLQLETPCNSPEPQMQKVMSLKKLNLDIMKKKNKLY